MSLLLLFNQDSTPQNPIELLEIYQFISGTWQRINPTEVYRYNGSEWVLDNQEIVILP